MTIDEFRKELFKRESNTVREKIKNSVLYGYQIDMEDIDELITASYWLGFKTARDKSREIS